MDEIVDSSQTNAAFKRDWTKGSILNNLLLLSWPMVVMELLWVISQIVDMIWVGRLGSASIAGVGVSSVVVLLLMSIDIGLVLGSRAMIARYIGAKDFQKANNVTGQVIFIAVIWGAILTIIGTIFTEQILSLFAVDDEVVSEGSAYLRIIFAGWIPMEVLVMSLYAVQSSGDTTTPLIVEASMRAFHVTLCPLLVLGIWVFPHLGVTGAALANVISQCLGAIALLWLLFNGRTRLRLSIKDFIPVPGIIMRILKIGIPALVMNLQKSFGDLMLMWIIAPFGTMAVAAHSLVFRIELFLTAPCIGIGGGAGVLVGQNLGAREPKRAEKSSWIAIGVLEGLMAVCSLAILFWAENIIGIFTNEPDLIQLGGAFLRIAMLGYLMIAIVFVMQYAIAGAGDTLPTMLISIGMLWVVQLPLAFLLPQVGNLGIFGVRWAMVIGAFVGAVLFIIYFIKGRWKTRNV